MLKSITLDQEAGYKNMPDVWYSSVSHLEAQNNKVKICKFWKSPRGLLQKQTLRSEAVLFKFRLLGQEHRLRAFENRVMRRMFGPKRGKKW
jgi:hypothetical protein